MQVKNLQLYTSRIEEMGFFYTEKLGLPIAGSLGDGFTLQVGDSQLTFTRSLSPAYYHFAFNIPSFQIREALDWLRSRVKVLETEDGPIVNFTNWNAEALYFFDPAGNIVELIARKNLEIPGTTPFSHQSILEISEVGLPVPDVSEAYSQLKEEAAIPHYWGDYEQFCAAGDEHGLFIIVPEQKKIWYPTDLPARAFPFHLSFQHAGMEFALSMTNEELLISGMP